MEPRPRPMTQALMAEFSSMCLVYSGRVRLATIGRTELVHTHWHFLPGQCTDLGRQTWSSCPGSRKDILGFDLIRTHPQTAASHQVRGTLTGQPFQACRGCMPVPISMRRTWQDALRSMSRFTASPTLAPPTLVHCLSVGPVLESSAGAVSKVHFDVGCRQVSRGWLSHLHDSHETYSLQALGRHGRHTTATSDAVPKEEEGQTITGEMRQLPCSKEEGTHHDLISSPCGCRADIDCQCIIAPGSLVCEECSRRKLQCPGLTRARRLQRSVPHTEALQDTIPSNVIPEGQRRGKANPSWDSIMPEASNIQLALDEVNGLSAGLSVHCEEEIPSSEDEDEDAVHMSTSWRNGNLMDALTEASVRLWLDEARPLRFRDFLQKITRLRKGVLKCHSCDDDHRGAFPADLSSIADHYMTSHSGDLTWARGTNLQTEQRISIEKLMQTSWAKARTHRLLYEAPEEPAGSTGTIPSNSEVRDMVQSLSRERLAELRKTYSQTPQWDALRELRGAFCDQHRRFLHHSRKLTAPHPIRRYAERFKTFEKVLIPGLATYKKVLQGQAAVTAREVFCLVSLLCAMAATNRNPMHWESFAPAIGHLVDWKIMRPSHRVLLHYVVGHWLRDFGLPLASWSFATPHLDSPTWQRVTESRVSQFHPDRIQPTQSSMQQVLSLAMITSSADIRFKFSELFGPHLYSPLVAAQLR
ncbi:hypothetical protein LIA77_01450 [Sarocladium implicatum]|nr:hypothetical protein LIA77_01450 [Sarocladium implicatum]